MSTFALEFTNVNGQLAQLVQSICLTSRGSGVRIPHCPPLRSWEFRFQESGKPYQGLNVEVEHNLKSLRY